MTLQYPGNMRTLLVSALIATTPLVALAQAPQVPARPTLPQADFSQSATPGQPRPTTRLTQRNYDTTQQQMMPTARQAPQPSSGNGDFFYIDEESGAADAFADDLSAYNEQRLGQAGSQLRGEYGDLARSGMPAGMMQRAWDRPFDNMSAGQSAPGTIRYQWSADMVMPVRLRAGMVTNLAFPQWEAIEDVMIGDGATVEARILRPNQLAVKSLQSGMDTSLSVVGGSGNIYTFYLRTEGRNTKLVSDLQVFVQAAPSKGSADWFNGAVTSAFSRSGADAGTSGEAMHATRDADRSPEPTRVSLPDTVSQGDEPVPTDKRIFNLKMFEVNEGDRAIAPEYAYTDGRFTYLHYPQGMTDRPAVFRIVDGVEGRVNTRITGRFSEVVVIEAIGDFILRSGSRAVCIMRVDADDRVMARK